MWARTAAQSTPCAFHSGVTPAEAYTTDMKIMRTAQGQPQTSTIKGSARWLSADCGAMKPFAPPKQ